MFENKKTKPISEETLSESSRVEITKWKEMKDTEIMEPTLLEYFNSKDDNSVAEEIMRKELALDRNTGKSIRVYQVITQLIREDKLSEIDGVYKSL